MSHDVENVHDMRFSRGRTNGRTLEFLLTRFLGENDELQREKQVPRMHRCSRTRTPSISNDDYGFLPIIIMHADAQLLGLYVLMGEGVYVQYK